MSTQRRVIFTRAVPEPPSGRFTYINECGHFMMYRPTGTPIVLRRIADLSAHEVRALQETHIASRTTVPVPVDYSNVSGHVTRTTQTVTVVASASPVVISSAGEGGGDPGGDSGGEEGGDGGGEGDPPPSAGFNPGDNPFLTFLLLLLLLITFTCQFALSLPQAISRALYFWLPDIRHVWLGLSYLLPDRVRCEVYRPHLRVLFRDRRYALRKPVVFRGWVWLCLRCRTLVLLGQCVFHVVDVRSLLRLFKLLE